MKRKETEKRENIIRRHNFVTEIKITVHYCKNERVVLHDIRENCKTESK